MGEAEEELHRQLVKDTSLGAKAKGNPITAGSELTKNKTRRNQSFTMCL